MRSHRRQSTFNEINVTPLTDVMLVLLITFLLSATAFQSESSYDVPLPRVTELSEVEDRAEVISVDEQGEVLGYSRSDLNSELRQLRSRSPHSKIAIAVHRDCRYGNLFPVLESARQAGWAELIVLTEANP